MNLLDAADLRPEVVERHSAFVDEVRRRALTVSVNLKVAYGSPTLRYQLNRLDDAEGVLQTMFSWVHILLFPLGIALIVWSEWWIGVLVIVLGGFGLWGVDRRWMARLVLKRAKENPAFFGQAVDLEAIVLPPDFATWDGPAFEIERHQEIGRRMDSG